MVDIGALGPTLRGMARMLGAYGLTFLVLGGMWFRHRTEFTFIARVDRPLAWLNVGLLGFVALVPWSASLVGQHPTSHLTVFVYNVNRVKPENADRRGASLGVAPPERRSAEVL